MSLLRSSRLTDLPFPMPFYVLFLDLLELRENLYRFFKLSLQGRRLPPIVSPTKIFTGFALSDDSLLYAAKADVLLGKLIHFLNIITLVITTALTVVFNFLAFFRFHSASLRKKIRASKGTPTNEYPVAHKLPRTTKLTGYNAAAKIRASQRDARKEYPVDCAQTFFPRIGKTGYNIAVVSYRGKYESLSAKIL